jgi:hypothetical protein
MAISAAVSDIKRPQHLFRAPKKVVEVRLSNKSASLQLFFVEKMVEIYMVTATLRIGLRSHKSLSH